MTQAGVVIVGGGLAGQRCAATLRSHGFVGAIRMVCGEPHPPYDRPPLSKDVLITEDPSPPELSPPDCYTAHDVRLLLGRRARRLHPSLRELELEDGSRLAYSRLLVATGARPRRIAALERFSNVHLLRTIGDALRLRFVLRPGLRLVVIGAGLIGQEVASAARRRRASVTLVEALEAPLLHVVGAQVGRWFADLHAEEGVEVITSTSLEGVRGGAQVQEVILADGRRLECDAVVVGIGVEPAEDWLRASGLEPTGVRTDAACRTRIPGVLAAGDAARPWDSRLGAHVRSEHWDAASRQGATAARAMLGNDPGPPAMPSFWSDQYALRIQIVGYPGRGDAVLLDGDPAARDFSALFHRGGKPVGGLAVGRPGAVPEMRRRIQETFDARHEIEEVRAA